MTIAHTGIIVPKAIVSEVVAWYLKALEPLGYKKLLEHGDSVFGLGDKPFEADWWIVGGDISTGIASHHAFHSPDRAKVEAFYKAAIDAGAKDNGPPGIRAQYHPNYYAAFVIDLAGNNIEVMTMAPPEE
ncbi:related to glyoxalase family protein [Cephalotrichum gorgonifer]|uniref:Related to glyoxalase family protein n=1 Tax=Cephalotrichum gorgonifer TaxID=2041049 RepID=A0AAE8MSY3_9PEZI|nr:related to glyoxalase family protein [Cephalotrichum gorgonifer]